MMKKIMTLLCSTVVLTSAIAQSYDRRDSRPGGYNKEYNNNTAYQNNRNRIYQRDMLIRRISAGYDQRIQQVSYDRFLNRREKKRIIKNLMAQKSMEINRIYSRYNNASNRDRVYR